AEKERQNERIAELEDEVARLKSQLNPSPPSEAEENDLAAALQSPSRSKLILFSVSVVLLALGIMAGVFLVLSSVISDVSSSAADSLSPVISSDEGKKAPTQKLEDPPETLPIPNPEAPGL
ncbi:MAG: hypothetical protein V1754_06785, partial [Pseudomonadota bacterium]